MNLLFTGASGFLGKNIRPVLDASFDVKTLGIEPDNDYCVNLASTVPCIHEHFDVVLHAAGKAHTVPKTQEEKDAFFSVNLNGTKNLCAALAHENLLPQALIYISSVAVYGLESGENINEKTERNGSDPYALSKIQAEDFLSQWCADHNVVLTILRPSLIAGINPPGNLGAMINGIRHNKYLSIGGGKAHKSLIMAEDIARVIPLIYNVGGTYNICDDENPSFRQIEGVISEQLGKKKPPIVPFGLINAVASIVDAIGINAPISKARVRKMVNSLTFSNEKIKSVINWKPTNVLENFKIE